METILERQRHAHEDIERLEQAITDRLLAHPRTIRDRLQLDHEIAEMLEKVQLRSHSLRELYADHDSVRALEIANLSAASGFDAFYTQLSSLRDHHKRYPDNTVEDLSTLYDIQLPDPNYPVDSEDRIAKLFSGEESYGKFFDLNALHSEFVNLKRNRTISYSRYLEVFDSFDAGAFPVYVKQDPQYGQYLDNLLNYLESFYRRTVPLDEHAQTIQTLNEGFEDEWRIRSATNGEKSTTLSTTTTAAQQGGIWCDVCEKLYSKQTVYDGHMNSKKHKAGMKRLETGDAGSNPAETQTACTTTTTLKCTNNKKQIARKEWVISKLALKFANIKSATKSNVARKQTLTDKEWQAEQLSSSHLTLLSSSRSLKGGDAGRANGSNGRAGAAAPDDSDADSDTSDSPDKIYNPLKLPLGWDGKPIPFWLWRLHGLGVEYPCEICGNHIYMGRKSFDRHFSEPRHMHGLKCLGISSSSSSSSSNVFDQITSIGDAVALWERVKGEQRRGERRKDEHVEMEDESGNVMSAKVYNDLVAQGIL